MKRVVWMLGVLVLGVGPWLWDGALWASPDESSRLALRLYSTRDGQKRYFTGYDWLQFDMSQKIQLVEKARQGASRLRASMMLPAEVYIKELDRMYRDNVEVRHIEVGYAIEGVATVLKDWESPVRSDRDELPSR